MPKQDANGQPVIPLATGNDEDDVFFFVGFVSFLAQGLEAELVNLAVVLEADGDQGFADDVDQLFDSRYKDTLGALFRAVRAKLQLPPEAEKAVTVAVGERNRLAHHFFREHTDDFLSAVGRRAMIDDLRAIGEKLLTADLHASEIGNQLWALRGVTMAMRQLMVGEVVEEARKRDAAV